MECAFKMPGGTDRVPGPSHERTHAKSPRSRAFARNGRPPGRGLNPTPFPSAIPWDCFNHILGTSLAP